MQQLGRSALLTALMLGLSALGVLRHTHAQHVRHADLHHHAPSHSSHSRRASRANGRCGSADQAHADHTSSHIAPRGKSDVPPMFALAALPAFRQHFERLLVPVRFAGVGVVALGSAARAPGSPRGPPSLS